MFGVKNSPELREAYETVLPEVVEFGLRARQSQPIYEAIKALKDGPEWSRLSEAQQRIVADHLRNAELGGHRLDGRASERFNAIEQELSQLSTDFSNHVLDATKAYGLDITDAKDAEGWPETLRQLAAQAWNKAHADAPPATAGQPARGGSRWKRRSTSRSWNIAEIAICASKLYRAFITRAATEPFDNSGLIPKILQLRQETGETARLRELRRGEPVPQNGRQAGCRARHVRPGFATPRGRRRSAISPI